MKNYWYKRDAMLLILDLGVALQEQDILYAIGLGLYQSTKYVTRTRKTQTNKTHKTLQQKCI